MVARRQMRRATCEDRFRAHNVLARNRGRAGHLGARPAVMRGAVPGGVPVGPNAFSLGVAKRPSTRSRAWNDDEERKLKGFSILLVYSMRDEPWSFVAGKSIIMYISY